MYHQCQQSYKPDGIEKLLADLLYKEFGYAVGQKLLRSHNVTVLKRYLDILSKKKTEKGFSERKNIREELEGLLSQLLENEVIAGVNTCEWVVDALVETGAVEYRKP